MLPEVERNSGNLRQWSSKTNHSRVCEHCQFNTALSSRDWTCGSGCVLSLTCSAPGWQCCYWDQVWFHAAWSQQSLLNWAGPDRVLPVPPPAAGTSTGTKGYGYGSGRCDQAKYRRFGANLPGSSALTPTTRPPQSPARFWPSEVPRPSLGLYACDERSRLQGAIAENIMQRSGESLVVNTIHATDATAQSFRSCGWLTFNLHLAAIVTDKLEPYSSRCVATKRKLSM